jgi:hypothetical protein
MALQCRTSFQEDVLHCSAIKVELGGLKGQKVPKRSKSAEEIAQIFPGRMILTRVGLSNFNDA